LVSAAIKAQPEKTKPKATTTSTYKRCDLDLLINFPPMKKGSCKFSPVLKPKLLIGQYDSKCSGKSQLKANGDKGGDVQINIRPRLGTYGTRDYGNDRPLGFFTHGRSS
jgi:hypothetical protein